MQLRLSHDAFGAKRPARDWRLGQSLSWELRWMLYQWTFEGFTGHRTVESAGLVHMGGRLYDPRLGRFLQADPFVQFPTNSQGLNRYSYVLNNPLSYTDSTGYAIDTRGWLAIAVGIATGGASIAAQSALASFTWAVGGGFVSGYIATDSLQGAAEGAFTAAAFYGIANHFGGTLSAAGDDATKLLLAKSTAMGTVSGIMAEIQGGQFGHGFASAGVTSFISPQLQSIGEPMTETVVAAVVGGSVSEATGGKFANGAVTGAFAYAVGRATQGQPTEGERLTGYRQEEIDALVENSQQVSFDYISHSEARGYAARQQAMNVTQEVHAQMVSYEGRQMMLQGGASVLSSASLIPGPTMAPLRISAGVLSGVALADSAIQGQATIGGVVIFGATITPARTIAPARHVNKVGRAQSVISAGASSRAAYSSSRRILNDPDFCLGCP